MLILYILTNCKREVYINSILASFQRRSTRVRSGSPGSEMPAWSWQAVAGASVLAEPTGGGCAFFTASTADGWGLEARTRPVARRRACPISLRSSSFSNKSLGFVGIISCRFKSKFLGRRCGVEVSDSRLSNTPPSVAAHPQ